MKKVLLLLCMGTLSGMEVETPLLSTILPASILKTGNGMLGRVNHELHLCMRRSLLVMRKLTGLTRKIH